jgi:23S rRNA (guanosine2251-2'-O)-methyltransferase
MAAPDGSTEPSEYIFGLHAVREALRSAGRPLTKLLVGRTDRPTSELVQLARSAGIPVHFEPAQKLDRLVQGGRHQGVVALVAAKRYADPNEMIDLARSRNEAPLLVVLDGVEDPHNLGAILRTVEAAGGHGVIIPDRRAVGLTGTVAKVSAGALEHLHVAQVGNITRAIESLKAQGVWVYALDPDSPKSYTSLDLTGPIALVLGGEGSGVRLGVRKSCDDTVRLPMRGRVASLNVSAAAAVILYEVVRQRIAASDGSRAS